MGNLTRRDFVALSGAAGLALAGCSRQTADTYPYQDITFIIPNAPGGNFDAFVRVIAPAMEKNLLNPVNIIPLNVSAGGGGKGLTQLTNHPASDSFATCNPRSTRIAWP